ncbi:LysR family transcriptional regulator [uncultured Ferrimonas sp.]|uniref:LysR family transcriptional regulator n=1 Tax=uncultured Ferrimonas sp. TaxID=432640 RepID=UPI002602EC12|nr:LysR family transcriptional regulator [uncultured Ferrimonas sp.]
MEKWTELRTAYRLAQLGTLSATAKALGVHRSTVMRHIDGLEASLQVTLFQRNDRGYIATDAGLELMRLGQITEEQFSQFANRAKSQQEQLQGTLTITCVDELAQLLFPAINCYQARFEQMRIEIIGDIRQFKLEYGEADVAIRTGAKPTTLDNVVLPFFALELGLYAHQSYLDKRGLPQMDSVAVHDFIAMNERQPHLAWNEWIHTHVPAANIKLQSRSHQVLQQGLQQGIGVGIAAKFMIDRSSLLQPVLPHLSWSIPTWILVHRDVINLPKVRHFIDILNANKPR